MNELMAFDFKNNVSFTMVQFSVHSNRAIEKPICKWLLLRANVIAPPVIYGIFSGRPPLKSSLNNLLT